MELYKEQEDLPFAKLLIRRPDNSILAYYAVPSCPDIGQISTDYCTTLNNYFPIQNNVL